MVLTRNPEETRKKLLEAAFDEVFKNGFRSASLDDIIRKTGVTKGAFYHHFPRKLDLGYALVDKILKNGMHDRWVKPLLATDDPISALISCLNKKNISETNLECGCPLNNLAQEMSSVDEKFRQKIAAVYDLWIDGITDAFKKGQKKGTVRTDIDPKKSATFLVASLEGTIGIAKNFRDIDTLKNCRYGLVQYLESLRPTTKGRK